MRIKFLYPPQRFDPIAAPVISFVGGPKKVLPVRVSLLVETDTRFDDRLNPISATVAMEMRVLAYGDIPPRKGLQRVSGTAPFGRGNGTGACAERIKLGRRHV